MKREFEINTDERLIPLTRKEKAFQKMSTNYQSTLVNKDELKIPTYIKAIIAANTTFLTYRYLKTKKFFYVGTTMLSNTFIVMLTLYYNFNHK
jgi:hypothetical protein